MFQKQRKFKKKKKQNNQNKLNIQKTKNKIQVIAVNTALMGKKTTFMKQMF